jgi:hypothetical protein
MFWFFIILLVITFGLVAFYTVEAIIDLDRWIADAPNREANGYREPVNIMTPPTQPVPEPVKMLTPSLENFPKSSKGAKAKIDRLLKKSA